MNFFQARVAAASMATIFLLLPLTASAQTTYGIWVNRQELLGLPMSGAAWDRLKAQADASAGTPQLNDQTQMNNVYVLAKALVYARTGIERYRTEVIDQCMRAINTELGGTTLALGRELAAYVIAADLVRLPAAQNDTFRAWLRRTLSENLSGRTLRSTQEDRPNNWGTHASASRLAVAAYLGDTAEMANAARVFRGWLGDRSAYSGFNWGYLDWQCNPSLPVAINPAGCMKSGYNIDGVLPDDQRRAGGLTWPPPKENYVWEALQGAIVAAEILYRAGHTGVFEWSNRALFRAYRWLHQQANFPADGDDEWQPHIVNFRFGTSYPAPNPARAGKNMGWTDWTHGPGRVYNTAPTSPEPTPEPTPEPIPEPTPEHTPTPTSDLTYQTQRIQQGHPTVTYSGTWYSVSNSQFSGGSATHSMRRGATATFTFYGTAVTWIGFRDRHSGIARVYLDGRFVREIDTYSGITDAASRLFSATDLSLSRHTLVIETMGLRGTEAWGSNVWIDAFEYVTATTSASLEMTEAPAASMLMASTMTAVDIGALQVGYAPIRTEAEPSPNAGIATVAFRRDSILVTEASVLAARVTEEGRIYVEQSTEVSSGLAIANPNDEINTVGFSFTGLDGQTTHSGSFTIPARAQISRFSNEEPFNGASPWAGTLTFNSSLPVSATALRVVKNERDDFVLTTTPVAPLTPVRTEPVLIPHFADGGGWTNQLILVNPTDAPITGLVEFLTQIDNGDTLQAIPLTVNGVSLASTTYSIEANSTLKLDTAGETDDTRTGIIRVIPSSDMASPIATSIFSYRLSDVLVSEASISDVPAGRAFTLFAEHGASETGIVVATPNSPAAIRFELLSLNGEILGTSMVDLPAGSRLTAYISQLPGFESIVGDFQGLLRVTSGESDIVVTGLRSTFNERQELLISSVPAVDDALTHPNAEHVFPHFAFGSGYSTRFVVLHGIGGKSDPLDFHMQSGEILTVPQQ